jgi:ATP-dependent Clp protease protease subunit
MKIKKFWNWVKDETGDERVLHLNGPIAEETWWGDEVTPAAFKDELLSGSGPVTVWINSPGGDVFAAAQIYNMLMDYTGSVTVKIDGVAASAASVIAMAGGEVYMSPVSMLMIHNPATTAIGDSEEMLKAKALLDEVKEAIMNAYELKTGLSRAKISHMMDAESWMNANKAVELGFADKILFAPEDEPEGNAEPEFLWNRGGDPSGAGGMLFSRAAVANSLLGKLPKQKPKTPEKTGTPIESLDKRLSLISH